MLVVAQAVFEDASVGHGRKVKTRPVAVLVKVRYERVEILHDIVRILAATVVVKVLLPLARLREMVGISHHVVLDVAAVGLLADVCDPGAGNSSRLRSVVVSVPFSGRLDDIMAN